MSGPIGQLHFRKDRRLKVTGEARYTAEIPQPDFAYGVLVPSATGAAAIGNAVYHATGRRIRRLPTTPDKMH